MPTDQLPTRPAIHAAHKRGAHAARHADCTICALEAFLAESSADGCDHSGETFAHKGTGFLNDTDARLCADCGAEVP